MTDDAVLSLTVAVAVCAGLVVGGFPLVTVLRVRAAIRSESGRNPGSGTPANPDDLTPDELGFLLGGAIRAAEVAVTDAFLSGRVRQQSAGGFFTLVGPQRNDPNERDPLRRAIVGAFQDRVGVSAREMVRRVVIGRGVDQLRRGLARRGLIVDSPEIRELLARRKQRAGTANVVIGVALTLAIILLLFGSATTPGWTWLIAIGCMGAVGGAIVVRLVLAATGGVSSSIRTPHGDSVVREAVRRYTASGAMSQDRALRHTAVTGFRSLRANTSAPGRAPIRATGSSADRSYSGDGVPAGYSSSESYDLGNLCWFAELCQGSSGSAGGFSGSGDGWGGGLATGTGSSSSGSSGDGGGWFGGGDGGGGGGDGGGGGGGE
ncbi:TIGR04222 domain-containing membrane protein [Nocardiopsis sp. EMB25]|uniref:TIGR04222 domain-containing membrane protein n=1 Tax=Nocardiopsis sp. EMB25 TaxID=2835867 RepID=UPI002284E62F|nr:TIGR04222 domain-containing membrane protein [Nocardiopsis sp. EMB25]MCY9782491.1 TIGR04222 domain-containing membrane protein [Nocardiopsis sp. EMB25]